MTDLTEIELEKAYMKIKELQSARGEPINITPNFVYIDHLSKEEKLLAKKILNSMEGE